MDTIRLIFLVYSFLVVSKCFKVNHDNSWDALILAQRWLPTHCKMYQIYMPGTACHLPDKADSWTVHGVWPTNFDRPSPFFCKYPQRFRNEELEPIRQELDEAWPSTLNRTPSIWENEWHKHGSCMAEMTAWNTPIKYFKAGVILRRKFDLSFVLHKADIIPSFNTTYEVKHFENAVRTSFGLTPIVKCFVHENKQYVNEIHVCLSKNLNVIDCNFTNRASYERRVEYENVTKFDHCDPKKEIIYSPSK